MSNVHALMAWFEALQGLESVALSTWPHYSSAGKFAGLRWSITRRVKLSEVTISKVMVPGRGEVRDNGVMFHELCANKAWTNECRVHAGEEPLDEYELSLPIWWR